MIHRRCLIIALAIIVGGVSLLHGVQRSLAAQQSESSDHSMDARFASLNLRLAELELKEATETTENGSDFFSASALQRLRNSVAVASTRLQHVRQPDQVRLHAVHLTELEGTLKLAELNLANATKINERQAGQLDENGMERLRLLRELAEVNLTVARQPHAVRTKETHFQWQLDQLRADVFRLQLYVERDRSRK